MSKTPVQLVIIVAGLILIGTPDLYCTETNQPTCATTQTVYTTVSKESGQARSNNLTEFENPLLYLPTSSIFNKDTVQVNSYTVHNSEEDCLPNDNITALITKTVETKRAKTAALKQKMDHGDLDAQVKLGYYTMIGKNIPQDTSLGAMMLENAFTKGYYQAAGYLAKGYGDLFDKEGVDKESISQKVEFWANEAKKYGVVGFAGALRKAGCYYSEQITQQARNKAFKYHLQASIMGDAHSQGHLAKDYFLGKGVTKNRVQGVAWGIIAKRNDSNQTIDISMKSTQPTTEELIAGEKLAVELMKQYPGLILLPELKE